MYHFRKISLCSMHYYPGVSPHTATFSAMSIEGINSYRTHIYYTWVERDNCGQKALSRSIRTKRKSNPRPSDYESRTQTNAPQCSQILGRIFTIVEILGKSWNFWCKFLGLRKTLRRGKIMQLHTSCKICLCHGYSFHCFHSDQIENC